MAAYRPQAVPAALWAGGSQSWGARAGRGPHSPWLMGPHILWVLLHHHRREPRAGGDRICIPVSGPDPGTQQRLTECLQTASGGSAAWLEYLPGMSFGSCGAPCPWEGSLCPFPRGVADSGPLIMMGCREGGFGPAARSRVESRAPSCELPQPPPLLSSPPRTFLGIPLPTPPVTEQGGGTGTWSHPAVFALELPGGWRAFLRRDCGVTAPQSCFSALPFLLQAGEPLSGL